MSNVPDELEMQRLLVNSMLQPKKPVAVIEKLSGQQVKQGVAQVLAIYDKDHDGVLTEEEVISFAKDLLKRDGAVVKSEFLWDLYGQFDVDGDGKVTAADLEKVLELAKELMS